MTHAFSRSEMLLGADALALLPAKRVAKFGLGGWPSVGGALPPETPA
jgi:tRNA A37 threonylcarbamoyladenosine dehydratase